MHQQVEQVVEFGDIIRGVVDHLHEAAHHDHYECAQYTGPDGLGGGIFECLNDLGDLVALDDLLALLLECVVAAAGEDADQEHGQPRVGLHVINGPVLVLVGKVRDREAVREDHDKLHEGAHKGDDPQGRVELATLRELVVEAGEDGQQEEELEVVCYVPGPGEAGVWLAPGDHIIEEYDVPEPVLRAFCVRLVLMEKGTVTTEEDEELPEEENGEYVQGE